MKYKGKIMAWEKPDLDGSRRFVEFIDLGNGQEFGTITEPTTILPESCTKDFLERMNPHLDFSNIVLMDVELFVLEWYAECPHCKQMTNYKIIPQEEKENDEKM